MRAYDVQWDYWVPRLNGKDGTAWTEGTVVELDDDDADWVNRDRPGTLVAVDDPTDSEPEPEPESDAEPESAPTPSPTRPARGRGGRRRDSAG